MKLVLAVVIVVVSIWLIGDDDLAACESCGEAFDSEDLKDGRPVPAECCGRTGLCRWCRMQAHHACNE